uniref:Thiol:disulfide interchange protein n=1 Tax=Plumaria plumosa TaxID=189642 RepID=A0A4D6WZA4_9FLOR|nr:Thiol:disulfide interchange protein [Plumaria plumosa]
MLTFAHDFYDHYQVALYYAQQKIYYILSLNIDQFRFSTSIILFCCGIFTSFTPCFISLVPLSLAYINTQSLNAKKNNKNIFICGILTSLLLLIFLLNSFHYQYAHYINNIPIISALILCFISLNLLQILNFSNIFLSLNLDILSFSNLDSQFFIQNYVIGFLIGLSALPCSTSIIFVVIFWLSHFLNIAIYYAYLFIYILGCIISLLCILNLTISYSQIYIVKFTWDLIIPLSGCIMLTLSLFNLLEKIM